MADVTKAQKLAAARKKLKEFQQKSQKPGKTSTENDENITINEALSSSTHSSVNGSGHSDVGFSETTHAGPPPPTHTSPFHNYFQDSRQNNFVELHNNFFDSISTSNQNTQNLYGNTGPLSNPNITFSEHMKSYDNYNDENQEVNLTVINYNSKPDGESENKINNVSSYFGITENIEHPSISTEDAKKLMEYMGSSAQENTNKSTNLAPETNENIIKFEENPNDTQLLSANENGSTTHKPSLNSNSESLRQLSSQISDLLKDDTSAAGPTQTNELENRNQELAALLDQKQLEVQKFQVQLQESQNRIVQLESESQQIKIDYEHRLNRELGPLQEQLQCHTQTIGILVGEKTELSTELSQSQIVIKQKVTECEELQGRLKTSRSRVADLEKELQSLKQEKSKFEQANSFEEEIHRLKQENQGLKDHKEEITQDLLEIREKLNIKANENLALQREIQEVSHQLSLAQVKIEQITTGESLQIESQIEIVTHQKLVLEKQVLELSQALKATSDERDQASAQYQHYVQQLNEQLTSLANKLETLTTENVTLSNREQELVKHIGELEKHLQNIQQERLNFAVNKNGNGSSESNKELETALESIQILQSQKYELEDNYKIVYNEKENLQRELETKKELIERFEIELGKLQNDQPDTGKLLAAMESDKVAAARAVSQNMELKQQLEEMQQAFVRMSNDKLELTENLTSEQYTNKELSEKLENTENQLHTLSDAIAIKDAELTHMRETLTHQNKQILQKDQLTDRLRHYEAQDGSSQVLQLELQKAQEYIHQVVSENRKLKAELINQIELSKKSTVDGLELQPSQETNHQNEVENASQDEISNQYDVKANMEDYMSTDSCADLNILDKEAAMKHLEEKFTRTMLDIANLTEEKQRLEHIVTQLQGETETIGEYIALYQHQRGILKQRTQEKDEQLKRLAQDREKVRTKLDSLNTLVKKLVQEKGILTPEILEQHEILNSQSHELCTEHAKIHQEINKIANQNVPSLENKEPLNENNNVNLETAEQIIALLSEIKSSNLIQPSDNLENFHPCPWCSGQLLTV